MAYLKVVKTYCRVLWSVGKTHSGSCTALVHGQCTVDCASRSTAGCGVDWSLCSDYW